MAHRYFISNSTQDDVNDIHPTLDNGNLIAGGGRDVSATTITSGSFSSSDPARLWVSFTTESSGVAAGLTHKGSWPGQNSWPTGDYTAIVNITAAGSEMQYGPSAHASVPGHFARVNNLGTAHQGSPVEVPARQSGTGVKTFTAVNWTPPSGAWNDRLEVLFMVGRFLATHGTQSASMQIASGTASNLNGGVINTPHSHTTPALTGPTISRVGLTTHAYVVSNNTITVGYPLGVTAGDLVIVSVSNEDAAADWTTVPAGFTLRGRHTEGEEVMSTYHRVLTGSDPTLTFVANLGSPQDQAIIVTAYRGVDPTTPFDIADVTANGRVDVNFTPVTDNSVMVAHMAKDATMRDFPVPTSEADNPHLYPTSLQFHQTDPSLMHVQAFDRDIPTAGAQVFSAHRRNATDLKTRVMVLRPASTGVTGTLAATQDNDVGAFTGTVAGPGGITQIQAVSVDSVTAVTSQLITLNSTPVEGNLLVAFCFAAANRVWATLSGWSYATHDREGTSGSGRLWVFYKVAGASEPDNYTFSFAGGEGTAQIQLHVLEYAGLHDVQGEVLNQKIGFQPATGDYTSVSTGTTPATTVDTALALACVSTNSSRTFDNAWTNGFIGQQTVQNRSVTSHKFLTTTGTQETTESWNTGVTSPAGVMGVFEAERGDARTGTIAATQDTDVGDFAGTHTPPPITGTIAGIQDGDVGDFTGTHTPPAFTGTITGTQADQTGVFTGTVTPPAFTGTIATTQDDDTGALVGTHVPPAFTGTITATQDPDIANLSGTHTPPAFTGTIATTQDDDVGDFAGTHTPPPVSGTISGIQADDAGDFTGTSTTPAITGTIATTQDDDTGAFAGTHTPPPITGTIASTQADDVGEFDGTATPPGFTGTITSTQDPQTGEFAGTHTPPSFTGTIAGIQDPDIANFTGTALEWEVSDWSAPVAETTFADVVTGTIAVTQDPDIGAFSGTTVPPAISGTISGTQADDTGEFSGTFTPAPITGTIAATQDSDTGEFAGIFTPVYVGTITATQANDAADLDGTTTPPAFTGTISGDQDDQVSNLAGTHTPPAFTGTIAATQDDNIGDLTGTFTIPAITGTITAIQDPDIADFDGDVVSAGFAGSITATQDPNTGAFTGTNFPAITGTIAGIQDPDTMEASGTTAPPAFTGSIATTQNDDTANFSGVHTPPAVTGSIAATQDDDEGTFTGTVVAANFTGTIATTQDDNTANFAGTFTPVPITGTIAANQQENGGAFVGIFTPVYTGTVAVTQDDNTANFIGEVVTAGFAGTITSTQDDDTGNFTGTSVPPPITGTIVVTQDGDTLIASGTFTPEPRTGTITGVQDDDVGSLSGTTAVPAYSGAISAVQADDTIDITGIIVNFYTGTVTVTEEDDTMVAAGQGGEPITGVRRKGRNYSPAGRDMKAQGRDYGKGGRGRDHN